MGTHEVVVIRAATGKCDVASFRKLTHEYYQWLGEDLCFQGIEQELETLPGAFAPPSGCILLAVQPGSGAGSDGGPTWEPLGAVALRPLEAQQAAAQQHGVAQDDGEHVCEMKRLYVRPEHWGRGIGTQLAEAATAHAQSIGYTAIVLDTLERLTRANALYAKLGFRTCAAYYENPLPGVVYWRKDLG